MTALACPHLRRAHDDLDLAVRDLPAAEFSRVVTGTWTLADVLDHLARAYASTAHILDKGVHDGTPKGTTPRLVQRMVAAVVTNGWYFPTGIKAPSVTVPDGVAGSAAAAVARDALVTLDAACSRSLGAFGPRARVANHPLLGGFTVPQWRRFHRHHTEHHLRQIRRAFPRRRDI